MEIFVNKCIGIIDTTDDSVTEHEAKKLLGQCLDKLEKCFAGLKIIAENTNDRDAYTLSCCAQLALLDISD